MFSDVIDVGFNAQGLLVYIEWNGQKRHTGEIIKTTFRYHANSKQAAATLYGCLVFDLGSYQDSSIGE